ncbi:hypothetical protein D3C83_257100 [compost metagenome]
MNKDEVRSNVQAMLFRPRDDPDAQYRVAAELKEVVVYSDVLNAEVLLPDRGQLRLQSVARR